MSLSVVMALSAAALIGLGLISYLILHHRNRFQFFKLRNSRVLVLTAHPDDEVMFFAPTIFSLLSRGYQVFLLCLSSGDHDDLGSERLKELESAATNLGIPKSNLFVDNFKDDPTLFWDPQQIADCLERYHRTHDFSAIFTFDEFGISGHKNHISLFHGLSHFTRSPKDPEVGTYFLETVNVLRKYSFFLDSFFQSGPQKRLYFVSNLAQFIKGIATMRCHGSQMVWFRWLYVFFSRYMFFNSYRQGVGAVVHKTILIRELELNNNINDADKNNVRYNNDNGDDRRTSVDDLLSSGLYKKEL